MKFLQRVNYLGRFTYLFILIVVSLASLLLSLLFAELSNYQHLSNLDKSKFEYTEKRKKTVNSYKEYKRFLVSLDENILFLRYLTNPNEENYENVLILFNTLIDDKSEITQLRYIDETGKEKIRFDRNFYGEMPNIISQNSLQDKSNRDYFKKTMKLGKNKIYVSKLDLNIENGKIEKPIKPVWRFAIPVIYKNKNHGILIVNIFANQLLEELIQSNNFNIDIFDQDNNILVTSFKNKDQWTNYLKKESILQKEDFILKDILIDNLYGEKLYIAFTPKESALNFFKYINNKLILIILVILIVSFIFAYYLAKIPKKLFDELESQQKLILQQSKLSAMGEMIGMIAHQWRQPLNGISVLVQEIEIKKEMNLLSDKEFTFAVDNIKNSLNHMSQTINDFRDFLKPTKTKNEFNLFSAIEQSFELSEIRIKNEDIHYKIDYPLDINLDCFLITSYESEIKQVILNLINNSVDAFSNNTVEDKEIIVKLNYDEKQIFLEFIDNAGGIDNQILNKLFEPYSSTKEAEHGTGLGLYLSKMIIEKNLKGKISVENIDKGALFKLVIPK